MRQFLLILAAILVIGCSKDEGGSTSSGPIVDFSAATANIYIGGQVTIPVVLSQAATKACSVGLSFSGTAVKGTDYTVSAEKINFGVGESVGSIVITDRFLSEGKEIKISLADVNGLKAGNRKEITVRVAGSVLVCEFLTTEANVIERFKVRLKVTGLVLDGEWKASKDIDIPAIITGDAASSLYFCDENGNSDSRGFRLHAGSNIAEIWVASKSTDLSTAIKTAKLEVDTVSDPQFIKRDNPYCLLNVQGNFKFTGVWAFDHIVNADAVKAAFQANGDDISLLPLNNQGFTLTVTTTEKDGNTLYKIKPSSQGDFANYFREADLTNIAPKGLCPGAISAGVYTAMEQNRFIVGENPGEKWVSSLFFKLSAVNRSFRSDINNVGDGCISMRFTPEGDMEITIRSYDTPPFGSNSWNSESFDPEMFGFTAIFKKGV